VVVAARVGTGLGATVGGRDGTGRGDFPVGTGTGVAVPGLLGTGLATGAGDLYLVGAAEVGTADGVAARGTGAAAAGAEADDTGAAAVGVLVAVAEAAAAPCVS